jgi:acyl-CoA thioesterase-1
MKSGCKPLRGAAGLAGLLLTLAVSQWSPLGRTQRAAAQPDSQTIVAIGDSIVYGLHDEQGRGGWVGRLAEMLRRTYPDRAYRVVNAGINGDTSAGVLQRLDRDAIAPRPDLVIVAIGTNDFDYGVPLATFRANLRAILARLQARTHAGILVQSFLPETRVSDSVLRREATYNAAVPQVCRELHVGYLDLFNTFLALGRSAMTSLRYDSEHPTAAGYRFMAAETAAVIEGAYAGATGALAPAATPPGLDDLLPDDSLDAKAS